MPLPRGDPKHDRADAGHQLPDAALHLLCGHLRRTSPRQSGIGYRPGTPDRLRSVISVQCQPTDTAVDAAPDRLGGNCGDSALNHQKPTRTMLHGASPSVMRQFSAPSP
jgi:hypothetical protein